MIARVISGGQTGVDVAALRAAKARGIPTGGTMPRGFRTLAGPRPEYAAEFGMVEHASPTYPPRTFANVAAADMTIRIAVDFRSAGELCTLRAILKLHKPHVVVRVFRGEMRTLGAYHAVPGLFAATDDVRSAIRVTRGMARDLGRPVTLNVAGNSERTAPGIERAAEGIVGMILDEVMW